MGTPSPAWGVSLVGLKVDMVQRDLVMLTAGLMGLSAMQMNGWAARVWAVWAAGAFGALHRMPRATCSCNQTAMDSVPAHRQQEKQRQGPRGARRKRGAGVPMDTPTCEASTNRICQRRNHVEKNETSKQAVEFRRDAHAACKRWCPQNRSALDCLFRIE